MCLKIESINTINSEITLSLDSSLKTISPLLVTLKLMIKVSDSDELTTTELLIKLDCKLEVIVFTKQSKLDSLLMIVSQFWNLG